MPKYCFIDFEYNETNEERLNLVSSSFQVDNGAPQTDWLHRDPNSMENLRAQLVALRDEGVVFVAYNAMAEGRAFHSLGIDPRSCQWFDEFLEYRMLINHNHRLAYGKQLIDGKEKFTYPPKPKWNLTEEEKEQQDRSKPNDGLAAACYKLLGKKIDTKFKDAVRDLIISCPEEFTQEQKEEILAYNESDIKYLPLLKDRIIEEYKLLGVRITKEFFDQILLRGDYAARTAVMESLGYPVDTLKLIALAESVPHILAEVQRDINRQFPEQQFFYWNKKEKRYSWNQNKTREWIATLPYADKWMLTDGGKSGVKQYSLKLDAFKKFFDYKHDYPQYNVGAQFVRFLATRKNLNGFALGESKKKTIFDYLGTDGRVRPYFNIYKAQSSRSQPSATSFLFLKSAWMRAIVSPNPGRLICGIDYKSQEFLLAALISQDREMLKAYHSGDPYLYLAKLANAVPSDATKSTHGHERNLFKSTTLGIQYSMTKTGLAVKLSADTGVPHSQEEAQALINQFNRAYRDHARWKQRALKNYRRNKRIELPCGWMMFGDNDNERSVGNVPIQGLGASIMREAVRRAQDNGLDVIKTLHDALYIEFDHGDWGAIDQLASSMQSAFRSFFPSVVPEHATVGLDCNIWGAGAPANLTTEQFDYIKCQEVYIDERAEREYEAYKEYLEPEAFEI